MCMMQKKDFHETDNPEHIGMIKTSSDSSFQSLQQFHSIEY